MALNGFRLHRVSVRDGLYGRTEMGFGEGELSDPVAKLREDVGRAGKDVLFANVLLKGNPRDVSALQENDPVFRIEGCQELGQRALGIEYSYGNYGDFREGIDPETGETVDISSLAPTRQHSLVMFFPTTGSAAIMASSVRGRQNPAPVVLRALSALEYQEKGRNRDVLKWFAQSVFDESRLREVMEEGALEGLQVTAKSTTKAGTPDRRTVTITQNGVLKDDKRKVERVVRGWLERYAGRSTAGGTSSMNVFLEMLAVDIKSDTLTDGKFRFSKDGRTQYLGPSNLDRILTYPARRNPYIMEELHEEAALRLQGLQNELGIPLGL